MGMDVYGKKPKNEQGEYFRANVWYWHPLWSYFEDLHPTLANKVKYPHENSGDGLNARDSLALSKLLKSDLQSGVTQNYIDKFNKDLAELPLQDCQFCDQTGFRTWEQENGESLIKLCNSCSGTTKVKHFATWYHMDIELMKEFQTFLENCGGFQIW